MRVTMAAVAGRLSFHLNFPESTLPTVKPLRDSAGSCSSSRKNSLARSSISATSNVPVLQPMKLCGLVCKRWLSRTRCHLFSSICVDADNLGDFFDIIDSSALPLLSFVHQLRLRYVGRPFDAAQLARMHRCPNLAGIRIGYSGIFAKGSWVDSHASSSLIFLAKPALPMRVVLVFMVCVPSIETPSIWGPTRLVEDTNPDASTSSAPPRLAHLELRVHKRGSLFFSWLLSLPDLPLLKSLTFVGKLQGEQEKKIVEEYFQRAGTHVEFLDIDIIARWEVEDDVAIRKSLFQYTPNLQNVLFGCADPSQIRNILAILPASEYWHKIVVAVNDSDVRHGEQWIALDGMLAEPRFRALKVLSVIDRKGHYRSAFRPEVISLMPLATARGILK
ncbi:hypothetical protein FB451DRAFT_1441614 [Mycena latifolia]|nr:hypothetical protein FB451DRAFT_1441614 [Mycena latifolia]